MRGVGPAASGCHEVAPAVCGATLAMHRQQRWHVVLVGIALPVSARSGFPHTVQIMSWGEIYHHNRVRRV